MGTVTAAARLYRSPRRAGAFPVAGPESRRLDSTNSAEVTGSNLACVRDHNQLLVFHAIRTRGASTRRDLSKLTGLTFQTIENISLVACANVANLLLARALRQRRELAVRAALGVTGARLLRLLLAQSVLLALVGGLAALAVMPVATRLLRATLLPHVEWQESAVDGRALAVAVLVTLVAGLLTGLAPALAARRSDLVSALKSGAREGGGPTSRLRIALTVAQAAFSVLLLVAAGLFGRSLWRARRWTSASSPSGCSA